MNQHIKLALAFSPGIRWMLYSTFYFALANLCVKFTPRIPAHELASFRTLGVLALCYFKLRHLGISPWGNHKPYLILRGLFGTVALLLYFYSLQNMPLATAVTIQYLSPIFTTILAVWMLSEKPHPVQWLFFGLSFSGVLLIQGFESRVELPILLIGILAALSSGIAYNYVRKLKDHDHPLVPVFYFPLVSLILIGPYTATHWVQPIGYDWLWLILLGIFTELAQVNMTKAYQAEKMAIVANVNYVGLIFALIFGWFLFQEAINPLSLLGTGLIVAGVMLGSRYTRKRH